MSLLEKILKTEEEAILLKEKALQNREIELEKARATIKEFEIKTLKQTKQEVEKLLNEEQMKLAKLQADFNEEIKEEQVKLRKNSEKNVAEALKFLNGVIYK